MKPIPEKTLSRNIIHRIIGKCATPMPHDTDSWKLSGNQLMIDLSCAPELSEPGSAIRLEGKQLPERVLVIHGDDGKYYAFRNRCGHAGRRLDPVPGAGTIQCCSIGKTTCDYDGNVLRGSAEKPVVTYPTQKEGTELSITLS